MPARDHAMRDRRRPHPRPAAPPVEGLEARRLFADAAEFVAQIDFTPAGVAPADGYAADTGAAFGDRGDAPAFGWDADISAHFRDRGAADADRRLDTVAPMQLLGRRTWELAVPAAGQYRVRVVAGDPAHGAGRYAIDVEGVPAVRFTGSAQRRVADETVVVSVTDGRLARANGAGAANNRLCYVEAEYVGAPAALAPDVAWIDAAADAPVARVEPGAVQVGRKLYVIGGYVDADLGTARRFDALDLQTLTWSALPEPPAGVPETHGAWAASETSFYIAGGQIGDGIPGVATANVWRFDTRSQQWSSLPALPEARYGGGMGYLDGELYFFGGDRPDRTTVSSDVWGLDVTDPSGGWVTKASLPLPGDHIAGAVVNGKVYAVGGEHGHSGAVGDHATYIQHNYLFAYDPAADAWTRLADLPDASSHCEATTLSVDGKIVVLGGQIAGQHITDTVRTYDPATDTWTQLTPLPGKRKGGAAAFYAGSLFFTNGQNDPDEGHVISRTTWVSSLFPARRGDG